MHNSVKKVSIDPEKIDSSIIVKAGKIIQNNGVVIFPAKCLYGVAAAALSEKTVEKVFHLKQRPKDNPILVLIPDKSMLLELVTSIPEKAHKLMDAFWPGNLTLVFEANDNIPERLTAGTKKIGVRIPVHPVAKALVEHLGFPITGTSANLSGKKSCSQADQLDPSIMDHADLVLDAGPLKGGTGSSIVDVTASRVQIIREGEVTIEQIQKTLTN